MLGSFFRIAAASPGRRQALRVAVLFHLVLYGIVPLRLAVMPRPGGLLLPLGMTLLLAAIVEGALLIGWRLTQVPRSQSLEFLLVSPLQPPRVFFGEALVGLTRLALVTLSGLPILLALAVYGYIRWPDVVVFLVMPYTWGVFTGLALTQWAYEPVNVRRWLERALALAILLYLIVGVLIGENLQACLTALPTWLSELILGAFYGFHANNPFGVMGDWCEPRGWRLWSSGVSIWTRMFALEAVALAAIGFMLWRSSLRLQGHFQDRHYRRKEDRSWQGRGGIGERPLSWWAVKRVMEYPGRLNLYLAGGFGVLYAAYVALGTDWPAWLGRRAFQVVDVGMGGVAGFTTGLVVLAAVPAAFQYGLWDSSVQDRCRRLEMLLVSELKTRDYFLAALAAAWRRGAGYFFVALLIWAGALLGGRLAPEHVMLALGSALVLLALYFAVGFWSFVKGLQANGLGSLLTLGLPMFVVLFAVIGPQQANWLLPPGAVYASQSQSFSPLLVVGWLGSAGLAVWLFRRALAHGDRWLRRWYGENQGKKAEG